VTPDHRGHRHDPERHAWLDLFEAANGADSLGLAQCSVAGGVALVASGVDSLLFNRAFGVDAEHLFEVVRTYEQHGVARYMIARPIGLSLEAAAELGLETFHRPWIRLAGRPRPQVVAAEGFELRSARAADAEAIAALYCAGLDVPSSAEPLIAGLIERPRWHVYVATVAGEVVGLGISHLDLGHAYLFGGVTAPAWRGRGVQRALVALRVNHAYRCGATSVCSDTGAPVPGQPNHSQRNLERAGLAALHLCEHLVPRGTTWIQA
jgi:GNAT superfamily N-acetyltransferase